MGGGKEEGVSCFFEGTRRDVSTKRLIGEPRLSGYSFPSTVRVNRVFFGLFPSFHGYMSENIIYIALSQAKEVEA